MAGRRSLIALAEQNVMKLRGMVQSPLPPWQVPELLLLHSSFLGFYCTELYLFVCMVVFLWRFVLTRAGLFYIYLDKSQTSQYLGQGWPCGCVCSVLCSVVSDSLWPYGLQPARLFCPWNFPGKNTGMGSHSLFQWIFPNPHLLCLLHWLADSLPLA